MQTALTHWERHMTKQLRYVHAKGGTLTEIHVKMQNTPLFRIGDCILVWVNEGDFWMHNPIDVETEDRDQKEYERLKAKFEK